ncbi:hypothetical protein [Urbifossiella limnaea]|uniref:Uncharacterized protein n=1 Tax=Urbifossiella limnaea TaxID=2528023 RepID=A0A517XSS4_9BACT|nr:hypothetical protein [Urbifossiella limnaea]QDU20551.1 hypothetical protein ETAA1_25060 [Urbifossiella limnaea]
MTYLDRLAQLSDADFIALWNAAGTTDEVTAQVVARVGRVPRWAVVAQAVALRKAGNALKARGPVTPPSSTSPAA